MGKTPPSERKARLGINDWDYHRPQDDTAGALLSFLVAAATITPDLLASLEQDVFPAIPERTRKFDDLLGIPDVEEKLNEWCGRFNLLARTRPSAPHPGALAFAADHLEYWRQFPKRKGKPNPYASVPQESYGGYVFTLSIEWSPAYQPEREWLKRAKLELEQQLLAQLAEAKAAAGVEKIRSKDRAHFFWLARYNCLGMSAEEATGGETVLNPFDEIKNTAIRCGVKLRVAKKKSARMPHRLSRARPAKWEA